LIQTENLLDKIEIFQLKAEHLDDILGIEKLSFPEPWSRQIFEREINLGISHFVVAKLLGKTVGYGGYWQVEDEAHIVNLAVHPEHRSKGYGRRILCCLLDVMNKFSLSKAFLEVRESNMRAIALYKSLGFGVLGIRAKYYGSENAIVMLKLLK
jgi:[ribosomal protein S18]-alanine N-acetyltransferase